MLMVDHKHTCSPVQRQGARKSDSPGIASLNLPERFAKVVFWDAAYGPREHQVKPFGPPAIWQYAGNVEVAGAVVDYNRASGGLAALKRALGTG